MKLIAYLSFKGNCEEALNFYKEALKGEIFYIMRYREAPMEIPEDFKEKVIHAAMKFGENEIYFSDIFQGEVSDGGHVSLNINMDSKDQVDDVFAKLSEGGHVDMDPQETFWGAYYTSFRDRFGVQWGLNCELKKD